MSLAATPHLNDGNIYAETVPATATGQLLLDFLACRYTHSSREAWSAPTATRPALLATATHHRQPTVITAAPPLPLPHYCRSAHGEAGRICLDAVPAAQPVEKTRAQSGRLGQEAAYGARQPMPRPTQLDLLPSQASPDTVLCAGQLLEYHRPPWREPPAPRWLWTLFADEHVLVLLKPSGLPVLPSELYHDSTVYHARAAHTQCTCSARAHARHRLRRHPGHSRCPEEEEEETPVLTMACTYCGRCSRYSGNVPAARRHPTQSTAWGWANPNPSPNPNPNPNHNLSPNPNPNPDPDPNPTPTPNPNPYPTPYPNRVDAAEPRFFDATQFTAQLASKEMMMVR